MDADNTTPADPPIAIIGGGPAGMALALALAQRGCRAQIFEARARGAASADQRVMALSHGSRQILDWLGVWPRIESAPVAAIHVSQAGTAGRTVFRAADAGVPALGYVTTAASLTTALDEALIHAGIAYRDQARVLRVEERDAGWRRIVAVHGEANARLVVYADGGPAGGSAIVERDYRQQAVICRATSRLPHRNVAYERFITQGSLALLPLAAGEREYGLIYVCSSASAAGIAAEDDATFIARLQRELGGRHDFVSVSARHAYPLGLRYRKSPVGERAVWLGNAAQTLHPVAGQGFNLALRDIFEFARTVAGVDDPGAAATLARYAARRRLDRVAAIGITNGLVGLFASEWPIMRQARGLGLMALDLVPPARAFFARRMMYGARAWL